MLASLLGTEFSSRHLIKSMHRDASFNKKNTIGYILIATGLALVLSVLIGLLSGKELFLWFLAMMGACIGLAGFCLVATSLAFSLAVFGLFLGSAAQLYVTEPLWYNSLYYPPRSLISLGMYLVVAFQFFTAGWIIAANTSWQSVQSTMQRFAISKLLIFLLLGTAFSVSILNYLRMGDLPGYYVQLAAYAVLLTVNLISVVAIYLSQPAHPILPERLLSPVAMVGFTFLASAGVSWFAFETIGHVDDEVSYIFQARTFAGGALWVPALPVGAQPAFEHFQLMFDGDRWFSPLSPGWPAVLALGVLAGYPWLINPILGAASVACGYGVLRHYAGARTARIGGLLLATSPWLIGLSATYMTHTLSLFLVVAAWYLLLLGRDRAAVAQAVMACTAGLLMGWLFLTRPVDGIVVGGLTGVFVLFAAPRLTFFSRIVPFGAGCIATGALMFPYNKVMTGDPLKTPMGYYFDATWEKLGFYNRLGFGDNVGSPIGAGQMEFAIRGHHPYEGLINTLNNVNSLHTDFLGWPIGSLALVWALFVWGRIRRIDLMPLAIAGAVILAYFFYWFPGSHYVGPRYWFPAILPLVYLSVRGTEAISDRLSVGNSDQTAARIATTVIILCLCATTVFLTYRSVTRFHHFRGYHDHFRHLDLSNDKGSAPLVLAGGDVGNIGSAYFLNDPFMSRSSPVFAKDLGPEGNKALFMAFPGRPIIKVDRMTLGMKRRTGK